MTLRTRYPNFSKNDADLTQPRACTVRHPDPQVTEKDLIIMEMIIRAGSPAGPTGLASTLEDVS
jgi:hypothetical protein